MKIFFFADLRKKGKIADKCISGKMWVRMIKYKHNTHRMGNYIEIVLIGAAGSFNGIFKKYMS